MPASHTMSDTSQDAIGPLGHLGTVLAHTQLAIITLIAFYSFQNQVICENRDRNYHL